MTDIPKMALVKQIFPDRGLPDVRKAVIRSLDAAGLASRLRPGEKVAVTAGSRGIKNIGLILKTVVDYIASLGCLPMVVSAMGSHGGGTVQGQLGILEKLGITPESMGVPVLASDRSLPLPEVNGEVFYVNSLVPRFDSIILVNRVKPHTSFHGSAESGLQKMLAVGLGGPEGASKIHSFGAGELPSVIPRAAAAILKHIPVLLGIALLEDSLENTMAIEAVEPADFSRREADLLDQARRNMPGLPFESLDILVVDEIGKNFSGTGMDTNVIGRIRIHDVPEPATPRIKRIVVLGVSPDSGGNAYGIGLADFTTRRLADGTSYEAMYLNAMTSTFVKRAMLPMALPDDLTAIRAAIKSLGGADPDKIRMVRIKNTLHIDRMLISESLLGEAKNNRLLEIAAKPAPMPFDGKNNLAPF